MHSSTICVVTSRRLEDTLDPELLSTMLEERFVKKVSHPSADLYLLNYTARAQFERVWNPVTMACRGLILNGDGVVIARPFRKFFNLDEVDDQHVPTGRVVVTEKLDGSLGVLYPIGDGYSVATRGSFTSRQAVHATNMWKSRLERSADLRRDWTYMVEIIYPENRVVVDYEGMNDLVLLGAVETQSGTSVPLDEARAGWPGKVVEQHPYSSIAEVLAGGERSGREGYVVHFTEHDVRFKIKHAEYIRLHRFFTDMSERRVWEVLSEGGISEEWLEGVPDELYRFVNDTRKKLEEEYSQVVEGLHVEYRGLCSRLGDGFSRSAFAAGVKEISKHNQLAGCLFAILDGKPFSRAVWAYLRPPEHVPLFSRSEDVG